MKKALLMVFACGMLMACHSDIDLKNVDTTAQLQMGMALPVGSVRAQLGDFVGQIQGLYIDSVNGGVITWRDTFPDSREYHDFDMKDHISQKDLNLKVYDKLDAAGVLVNGKITGMDQPVTLEFELPLQLKDINKELGKERLDSALIENARFSSIINRTDLPLDWEWIDSVELVLGKSVYRQAGNSKVIYRKGESGAYGKKFDTEIDNFSICLMKDRNMKGKSYIEYEQNVVDSVVFKVKFTFTVPSSAGQIEVPKTARFDYHLEVEFIDYKAIWGYFDPSKDMISKNVEIDLSGSWSSLSFLKNASTPFTDPKIDVQIETKVAGQMTIEGNYVYTINKDGDSTYASFNGDRKRPMVRLYPYLDPDPKIDPIGKSIQMSVLFDNSEEKGRIDKLFANMPQKLGYDFVVSFDRYATPQIRILPDTKVAINAVCTLPLKFRDGLFVNYTDTIRDVNLTAVNIDSLVRESQIIDSLHAGEVTLYVTALSEIPLTVKAVFEYFGKDGQPIKDPTDPTKLFNPFLEDTLRIVPPVFTKNAMGQWVPGEPGKSILTARMSKEKLKVVPDIKRIAYKVLVDNEALNNAFKANPGLKEAPLTSEQHLELNIGLTAQIDAIMNFNSKK